MLKFIIASVALTACAKEAAVPVQLMQVIGNPTAYEGKTFRTCGRASSRKMAVLYSGTFSGRSPVVVRLDRAIASKSGCIEAQMVRSSPNASDMRELKRVGTAFDGPYAPKSWHLKVVSVDPL